MPQMQGLSAVSPNEATERPTVGPACLVTLARAVPVGLLVASAACTSLRVRGAHPGRAL